MSAFWSGSRVALTGATGFVGHQLACQLVQFGADVTALVRGSSKRQRLEEAGVRCAHAPLDDPAALANACSGCEMLFHLAGAVDFEGDWERFRQVNVEGTRAVLQAARSAGVRRVVHTSSIVAVGASAERTSLDEDSPWNLGRMRVPYITTKRDAEELALASAGRGVDVVVVNPASVIGPDDFAESEFGTLCKRFWRGRVPFFFGGGNNFVDVRDVATGHLLAAEHGQSGRRYILGGENRTYAAFFNMLAAVSPRPVVRLRLPNAVAGWVAEVGERLGKQRAGRSYITRAQARLASLFFYFRCDRAHQELGYRPRPLRDTVRDAYDFWVNRRGGRRAADTAA